MRYKLFLDDERFPEAVTWVKLPTHRREDWVIVRNYRDFCKVLTEKGIPEIVSFDHDLGLGRAAGFVKNGKDCAEFLVKQLDSAAHIPVCYVHSMNPVGRYNILNVLIGHVILA